MLFNKMKNKVFLLISEKKQMLLFLSFLLLTIYYISFAMSIFWDTGHYMTYIEILEGRASFSSWDIVRGPTFPLMIFISNYLFGKTTQGIVILSFIFYLMMLYATKKILDRVFEVKYNKKIYIIIYLFLLLDPIIFGYYHTLLTEFVAMSISVILCYFSWKWMDIDFMKNKKKFIFYLIGFFVMSILAWHLKQPYVSIALFPIIISAILSIFENKSLKNVVQRILVICICIFGVIGSIKIWNYFLESKNINLNSDRNVTASLGKQLMIGLNNYEILKEIDTEKLEQEIKYLSNENKEKLKSGDYYVINIYNSSKELIDQDIIPIDYLGNITTANAFKFIIKEIFHHPLMLTESYISNYLAISNLYPKKTDDMVNYYVEKKLDLNYCHENCSIATSITKVKSNVAYMLEDATERVSKYEQFNKTPILFRYLLKLLTPISLIFFKILMFSLPFFIILATISLFRKKNKNSIKLLNIINILLWYSFLHIMVHVVTGATIDRYASPAIITMFIGMVLYIDYLIKRKYHRKRV